MSETSRPSFKVEHVAFNVADPVAVAKWYCENLGMTIARHHGDPAETHFLRDGGAMFVEIYNNPADQVPDYKSMDPLLLHLAFGSEDPTADSERLVAAGASVVDEKRMADGTQLVMMRDPWGLAIQLCKRAVPLTQPK